MAVAASYPKNEVTIKTADGPVTYDLALQESHTIELDLNVHKLDEAMPNTPTLTMLTRAGAPENVTQPIYAMMRKKQFPRFINLAGAYTAGDANLNIAAADITKLKRGFYVLNTLTRVLHAITGTPAAGAVPQTVVGEVVDASGVGASDELLILGYYGSEYDTAFVDLVRLPDTIFNFVGEYQTGLEISQYEEAAGHQRGFDPIATLRADKVEELRLNVQWGIMFSQRDKFLRTDADSKKRIVWSTGGADSFMTLNETDLSAGTTESALNTAMRKIRRYGASRRFGVCAPQVTEKIDDLVVKASGGIAGAQRNLPPIPEELGSNIKRLRYGGLVIDLVEWPLLGDAASTNANSLSRAMWVFDPSDFGLTTMTGPQMGFFKWFMNVQTPGTRGRKDQLIANVGVKMALPEVHARLIGF